MKVISALGFVTVAAAQPIVMMGTSSGNVRVRTTSRPVGSYRQGEFVAGQAVLAATGTQSVPGALDGQFGNLALVQGSPDYVGGASFWGGEQAFAAPAMYNTWETPAAASWNSWEAAPVASSWETWSAPAMGVESWSAPAVNIYEPAWNSWEAMPAAMPAWEQTWEAPAVGVYESWSAPAMSIYEPAWNSWEAMPAVPTTLPAWENSWEAMPAVPTTLPAWESSWSAPAATSWESSWSAPAAASWESSWSAPAAAIYSTGSWNDGLIYSPSATVNGIYTPSSWSSPSTQPANPLGPHTTYIAATTSGAFKPRIQGTNTPNPVPGSPSGGGGSCVGIGCGQTVQWGW